MRNKLGSHERECMAYLSNSEKVGVEVNGLHRTEEQKEETAYRNFLWREK